MSPVFSVRLVEKQKAIYFKYAHHYKNVKASRFFCRCKSTKCAHLLLSPQYARFYFINVTKQIVYEPLPQAALGLDPLDFKYIK